MIKKNKTFDSFTFRGELDFLEFRLTELDPFVNVFIIAELNSNKKNSIFIKNKSRFDKWRKKIYHIFVTEESYLNKITAEFINHNPDFDDTIFLNDLYFCCHVLKYDCILIIDLTMILSIPLTKLNSVNLNLIFVFVLIFIRCSLCGRKDP